MEGQCVDGYTGGGEMYLKGAERPLLAREGPTQPAKHLTRLFSTHSPDLRAGGLEYRSPLRARGKPGICGRRLALGAAPRGRAAGDGVESLLQPAEWLHLLQCRSAPARQG